MATLKTLELPHKVLATGFLVTLSCGFFVSHLYLHHEIAGEKDTFVPSLKQIAVHFHGEPGTTRLKKMVQGPMKKYFSAGQDTKDLAPDEQKEFEAVIDWNDRGAPEAEYWDPASKSPGKILNIIYDRCVDCHSPTATHKHAKKDSPLDTYPDIVKFTKEDLGMDEGRLLMLSHVHLLGMGLMFLGLGIAVALSGYGKGVRVALIAAGFASVLVDIGGWWAVKYFGPGWAWTVMAGGLLMGLAFGLGTLAALVDLWRPAKKISTMPKESAEPA